MASAIKFMENEREIQMIAHEAFIRRASEINAPFMLKGSYVTRQYFANPADRIPNDLDYVCLNKFFDPNQAEEFFTDWVAKVTEIENDDGVKFRSFRENEFWRMIDYAMADDFPTVNTDILCWVDEKSCEFSLDLSFNLDIPIPAVSLEYKPLRGDVFTISQTVPLALQTSWKLHQTLVRPRFKDIFDLIHLLKHSDFNEEVLDQALKALSAECEADNVDVHRLVFALTENLEKLFLPAKIDSQWAMWRRSEFYSGNFKYELDSHHITDAEKLPKDMETFQKEFKNALENAGFTIERIKNLPATQKTIIQELKNTSTIIERLINFFT